MATFESFEEIQAWQQSRVLIRKIRTICKKPTVRKDFAFVDQITRSARSVSANIAEGFEALTVPEFINFLGYAKRSSGEVRSHLYDALDEQYITQQEFIELSEITKIICRMIAKLIHYLQSLDPDFKRTMANVVKLKTKNQELTNHL